MGPEAGIETAPRSERIAVVTLAAVLFVVFVFTSGSLFWPRFDDVNQFDEANYVNSGRLFVEK